jgi:hypothetical protein
MLDFVVGSKPGVATLLIKLQYGSKSRCSLPQVSLPNGLKSGLKHYAKPVCHNSRGNKELLDTPALPVPKAVWKVHI